MNTYQDSHLRTFNEATVGALDDKEGYAVALDTAENTVKLATSADDAIGVIRGKLQDGASGDGTVSVAAIGPSDKVVAGGVIAKGARVKAASGGKVVTAASTDRSIGIKLTQGSSADGDVIEIIKVVEVAP